MTQRVRKTKKEKKSTDTVSYAYKVYKPYKAKVKLLLCFFLTEHHAMEAYWGGEV
jgi:hypothetical protein